MKFRYPAFALGIAAALAAPAWAADEPRALQLKPRLLIAPMPAPADAPFQAPMGQPNIDFIPHDLHQDEGRSSCNANQAVCYDADSRRLVYKAARHYMPTIPGMQSDDISLRKDRIVFHYTF